MSRISMNCFSQALAVGVSLELVYPADSAGQIGVASPEETEPPAVLYLLHGLSDDHTAWHRYTSIERYARRYNLAVVMPAVNRSFYRDMAFGPSYWTFVSDELPAIVRKTFHVSHSPQRTFIAGLSMGGYGALIHSLTYPERFAAAASFSGVMDIAGRFDSVPEDDDAARRFLHERRLVFGDVSTIKDSEHDLFACASRLAAGNGSIPVLYLTCGTEDRLYPGNQRFHEHLTAVGVEHTFHTEPGDHEWSLWDRHIDQFLRFLETGQLLS